MKGMGHVQLRFASSTGRALHGRKALGLAVAICLLTGVLAALVRRPATTAEAKVPAPVSSAPVAASGLPSLTTTLRGTSTATKATVDVLLAKVVTATSAWIDAEYKPALTRAGVAKVVLGDLQATYEAIGRLPSEVPSDVSSSARTAGIHLWTRTWSEFECVRVENGYTSDRSGCGSKSLFPDPFTLAIRIIDLLAPYSDMSSADWVAQLNR